MTCFELHKLTNGATCPILKKSRSSEPMAQTITNNNEALTEALTLAINAPTEELKNELIGIAEGIAQQLTEDEIEACKAAAKTNKTNF